MHLESATPNANLDSTSNQTTIVDRPYINMIACNGIVIIVLLPSVRLSNRFRFLRYTFEIFHPSSPLKLDRSAT